MLDGHYFACNFAHARYEYAEMSVGLLHLQTPVRCIPLLILPLDPPLASRVHSLVYIL